MGGNKNTKWNILWVAVNFTTPANGIPGGCKPTKDCYVSGTIGLAYVGTVCQMEKLLGFSILQVLTDCCVVNLQKGRHQVRWPKLSKANGFFQVRCRQVINVVLYIAHAHKRLVLVVDRRFRLGDVLKNRVNSANRFRKQLFLFWKTRVFFDVLFWMVKSGTLVPHDLFLCLKNTWLHFIIFPRGTIGNKGRSMANQCGVLGGDRWWAFGFRKFAYETTLHG